MRPGNSGAGSFQSEGMRAGEIAALRVKNVDLLKRQVQVVESASDVNGTIHFSPPKNGKPRQISIPSSFTDPLMEQMVGKGPDAFVFATNGSPMRHGNFYSRDFRPAVELNRSPRQASRAD
jgi:integrase